MGLEDFTGDSAAESSVTIANISQDHWRSCASGPNTPAVHDGHTGPWTAVPGNNQTPTTVLQEDDIILARRTNRTSDGKIGSQESGVCGIWRYCRSETVDSQSDHPFGHRYRWYVYCDDIETRQSPIYNEDWEALGITPQKMTGDALYSLSPTEADHYLEAIITTATLATDTRKELQEIQNRN